MRLRQPIERSTHTKTTTKSKSTIRANNSSDDRRQSDSADQGDVEGAAVDGAVLGQRQRHQLIGRLYSNRSDDEKEEA